MSRRSRRFDPVGEAVDQSGSHPSVRCLIFSKDRPLQLDGTLRSFALNVADDETADIHVLYRASTPRYAAGYRVLAVEHPGVALYPEHDFRTDLLDLLTGSTHVLFLVDDTLFVSNFSLTSAVEALERADDVLGFSYRLGRNTTYCYTLDKPQQLPSFESVDDGLLSFEWTGAEFDFGYPLEVSSSLYRTADVLPVVERLAFSNPNTFEAALAQEAPHFRGSRRKLACYETSVALSVPVNLVQTAWLNRVGTRDELSPGALLGRYEMGDRLDVTRFMGLVPKACHQELAFEYQRRASAPTVSVVIPCYKQAHHLADAVHSIVAQTFPDWEIVVVDDGSPDDTAAVAGELIAEFGDRIRLIRQPNAGLAAARNSGVIAARGRYILPLDADDMVEPSMLAKAVGLLERDPTIAIAYTDLQQFGDGTALIRAAEFDPRRIPEGNQLNYCSLYRREVWEAVGGYNTNMIWGYEDWDFWVGAAERGYEAKRIPEPLFLYRIRSNSMYATALQHDAELRRQMRLNHPGTYSVLRTFRRRALVRSAGMKHLVRRVAGRIKRWVRVQR